MGRYLRRNTAARITVGPFLDKTDGVTPETALTVTNCKLTMMIDSANVPTLTIDANATASDGDNDMVHVTGDDAGFYDLELNAAQTDYLGRAMLAITDAANHCPVFHEFTILPAQVYDSLVLGSDLLDANTAQVNGTAQTAGDLSAQITTVDGIVGTSGVVVAAASKTGYSLATAPPTAGDIATAVWAAGARTLTSFGSLVADSAAAVWSYATRVITGGGGGLDAAGVRAAMGLAAANLDTQLDALPTAAENATAVGAQAAAAAALAAYGAAKTSEIPAAPLDAAGTRTALGLAAANLDTQLAAIPTNPVTEVVPGTLAAAIAAIPTNPATESVPGAIEEAVAALGEGGGASLAEIEGSLVLAKEATAAAALRSDDARLDLLGGVASDASVRALSTQIATAISTGVAAVAPTGAGASGSRLVSEVFTEVRQGLRDKKGQQYKDEDMVGFFNRAAEEIHSVLMELGAEIAFGEASIIGDGVNQLHELPGDFRAFVPTCVRPRVPATATANYTHSAGLVHVDRMSPDVPVQTSRVGPPRAFNLLTTDEAQYIRFDKIVPSGAIIDTLYYRAPLRVTVGTISSTHMPWLGLMDELFARTVEQYCREGLEFTQEARDAWRAKARAAATLLLGLRHLQARGVNPSIWSGRRQS